MKTTRQFCLLILAIALPLVSAVSSQAQFEESAKWVPESANVLVMVRAGQIMKSELAVKEHWKTDRTKAFNSGASFLPPSTKRLLIASQIDFDYMEPAWQVAVFEKSGAKIDILPLSERVKGNLETVEGRDAILMPNDSYLVKIDDHTLGTMSPANRQVTARWLRTRAVSTMGLSSYLTQAVKFADKNADVIVAFDFQDVIHPAHVLEKLKASGLFKDDEVEAACESLATMKGLTLGVTINDKISGAIRVDFDGSTKGIGKMSKALLLYGLKKNGLMIPDFEKWDVQVSDNQMLMSGPLSRMGLRQIGSLVEQPLAADLEPSYSEGQNEVDMKTRSQQYFGSIQTLINELRSQDFQAMATYSKYFEKYARKIDTLSVINVDPVVLSYGTYVADSMRGVSGGLADTNLQKVRDRQTYAGGTSDYHGRGNYSNWNGYTSRYGWGYSSYNQDLRNRQRVGAQAKLKGENDAKEIMREVDAETAAVRRQMSEKYQVDF